MFTEAIFRFFNETPPRDWEAIAESVTDNFRVITHDWIPHGRIAGVTVAPAMRGRRIGQESTVQFSSVSILQFFVQQFTTLAEPWQGGGNQHQYRNHQQGDA